MNSRIAFASLLLFFGAIAGPLEAKTVEDVLAGTLILDEGALPTKYSSTDEYASRLRKLSKTTLAYDKKTGKVRIYYAAFFAQPVNDLQVDFVIYDISNGIAGKLKKGAWPASLGRKGERAVYGSAELDQKKLGGNKKFQIAIEYKGKTLAYSQVSVRG